MEDRELAQVLEGHRRLMTRIAGRWVQQDAEDVVQTAYLQLWKARHTLRDEERVDKWIISTVENTTISRLRTRERKQGKDVALSDTYVAPDDVMEEVEQHIYAEQLLETIRAVEGDTAAAVYTEFFRNGDGPACAKKLGISFLLFRTRIRRLRLKLLGKEDTYKAQKVEQQRLRRQRQREARNAH